MLLSNKIRQGKQFKCYNVSAVHIRLMGIRGNTTDGCKPQVNTGTRLQPDITVNPPQQQQHLKNFKSHKPRTGRCIDYREGGLKYTHVYWRGRLYEGCPSPWLLAMGER